MKKICCRNLPPLCARGLAGLLRRRPGSRSGVGARSAGHRGGGSRIPALHDHVALPLAGRRGVCLGDGGGANMAGDEIRPRGRSVRDLDGDGGQHGVVHGGEGRPGRSSRSFRRGGNGGGGCGERERARGNVPPAKSRAG